MGGCRTYSRREVIEVEIQKGRLFGAALFVLCVFKLYSIGNVTIVTQ